MPPRISTVTKGPIGFGTLMPELQPVSAIAAATSQEVPKRTSERPQLTGCIVARRHGPGAGSVREGGNTLAGMSVLRSRLDPNGADEQANLDRMTALVGELRARTAAVSERSAAGDAKSIARHRERGKLAVRERIDLLLDPGSAFLELSALAANGLYDDEGPSAGIVTGIGRIEGTMCVVVANDATVKGGSYFPMTVSSLIAGTYAPPAVEEPMTSATWGMPSEDIRAWLKKIRPKCSRSGKTSACSGR
jgi:hypothetical protein